MGWDDASKLPDESMTVHLVNEVALFGIEASMGRMTMTARKTIEPFHEGMGWIDRLNSIG